MSCGAAARIAAGSNTAAARPGGTGAAPRRPTRQAVGAREGSAIGLDGCAGPFEGGGLSMAPVTDTDYARLAHHNCWRRMRFNVGAKNTGVENGQQNGHPMEHEDIAVDI